MEWTRRKLAYYIRNVRTVVESGGITGDELAHIFESEAMLRLKQIQQIVYNEYLTDKEKLSDIGELISMGS